MQRFDKIKINCRHSGIKDFIFESHLCARGHRGIQEWVSWTSYCHCVCWPRSWFEKVFLIQLRSTLIIDSWSLDAATLETDFLEQTEIAILKALLSRRKRCLLFVKNSLPNAQMKNQVYNDNLSYLHPFKFMLQYHLRHNHHPFLQLQLHLVQQLRQHRSSLNKHQ